MKTRLQEKGCNADSLAATMEEVASMERSQLLVTCPQKSKEGPSLPFVTTFSTQHYVIKKIICKHWQLLGNDRIISKFLPSNPQVVFRGVPSLRDMVAPNVVDPPTKKVSFFQKQLSGYHQCRRWQVCKLNKSKNRKTESFFLNTGVGALLLESVPS